MIFLLLILTTVLSASGTATWECGKAGHGNSDIVGKIPTAFETAGEVACSSEKATDGEWLIDGKTPIKEGSCIAEEYHHTVKCTEASPVDSKCDQAWPKAVGCVAIALVDTGIIDCPKGKQIFFKQPGGAQFQGGEGTVTCWQGIWNVTIVSRDKSTTSVDLYRCKGNIWSIVKKKPDNSPTEQYAGEVTCSSEKATDGEWLIDGKTPIEEASCITQGWIELILSIRDLLSQAARFIEAFMTGNTIIPSSRDGGVADHESKAASHLRQYALTYKTVGKQRRGLKLSLYARVLRLLSYLGFAAMVTLSLLEKTVRTLVGTLCGVSVMILSATLTPAVNCRSIGGRSMLGFAVYLLILPGVECFGTNRSSTVVGRADSEVTSSGGWSNEAVIALACSALAIGMMMGGVGVYFFKRDPHPTSTNATPREFPLEGAIDDRTADPPVEQTTISSMTSRETTVAHDMDNSDPIPSPHSESATATSCTQLATSPTQSCATTSMIEEVRGAVRDSQLCDEMVAGSLLNSRVEDNQADSTMNLCMMDPPCANSTLQNGRLDGHHGGMGSERSLIYTPRAPNYSPINQDSERTIGGYAYDDGILNTRLGSTASPTSLPFLPSPSVVEAPAVVPRSDFMTLAARLSKAEGQVSRSESRMAKLLADLSKLLVWIMTSSPPWAEVATRLAALLAEFDSTAKATSVAQDQWQKAGQAHAERQASGRMQGHAQIRTPEHTEAPETLPVTIFTPGDVGDSKMDRSSIHARSFLGQISPTRASSSLLQTLPVTMMSEVGSDEAEDSMRVDDSIIEPSSLAASIGIPTKEPIIDRTTNKDKCLDLHYDACSTNMDEELDGIDTSEASPASPCAAPCASTTSTSSSPSTLGVAAASQGIPPASSPEHQRSLQQPTTRGQREDTEPCYVQLAREGSVLGNHEKPKVEGTARFNPESITADTQPAIILFPGNNQDVELDLVVSMKGYKTAPKSAEKSIGGFARDILNMIYENPDASSFVTTGVERSNTGHKLLPQTVIRTLAEFWMVHFTSSDEHHLEEVVRLIKDVLNKFFQNRRYKLNKQDVHKQTKS